MNLPSIRLNNDGFICLDDLHKEAVAHLLPVKHKTPQEFLLTDEATDFIKSLSKKVKGETHFIGKNSETYATRLLAQRYCGWLSPALDVAIYRLLDKDLHEECKRRAFLENARDGYKDLAKAITEHSGSQSDVENEMDMINLIVLGCTAKDFRKTHNLKDNEPLRDYLNKFQIETIEQLQRMDEQLINLDFNLKQRKECLEKRFADLSKKLLKLLTV